MSGLGTHMHLDDKVIMLKDNAETTIDMNKHRGHFLLS